MLCYLRPHAIFRGLPVVTGHTEPEGLRAKLRDRQAAQTSNHHVIRVRPNQEVICAHGVSCTVDPAANVIRRHQALILAWRSWASRSCETAPGPSTNYIRFSSVHLAYDWNGVFQACKKTKSVLICPCTYRCEVLDYKLFRLSHICVVSLLHHLWFISDSTILSCKFSFNTFLVKEELALQAKWNYSRANSPRVAEHVEQSGNLLTCFPWMLARNNIRIVDDFFFFPSILIPLLTDL